MKSSNRTAINKDMFVSFLQPRTWQPSYVFNKA